MNQNKKIGLIVLAVLVLLVGGIAYTKYTEKPLSSSESGSTVSNGDVEIGGIPEGATVEITDSLNADLYNNTPKPSLDRALPQGTLPADAYAILKTQREGVKALIKETPAAMNNWMSLGIIHKQASDYEGARIYWTYVATVNPENTTAHNNLAVLYANYLKDPVKAEAEFKKAITTDPKNAASYMAYAEFLVNSGKKDQALANYDSGIKAIPDNVDFDVAKAHLLRDMGKKSEARSAYDLAIKKANDQNNASLAATLTTEKNAL